MRLGASFFSERLTRKPCFSPAASRTPPRETRKKKLAAEATTRSADLRNPFIEGADGCHNYPPSSPPLQCRFCGHFGKREQFLLSLKSFFFSQNISMRRDGP